MLNNDQIVTSSERCESDEDFGGGSAAMSQFAKCNLDALSLEQVQAHGRP